jgi:hypothetical protein
LYNNYLYRKYIGMNRWIHEYMSWCAKK